MPVKYAKHMHKREAATDFFRKVPLNVNIPIKLICLLSQKGADLHQRLKSDLFEF